ncbi:hypothetical protein GQR36_06215 [Enterococcus termitis]
MVVVVKMLSHLFSSRCCLSRSVNTHQGDKKSFIGKCSGTGDTDIFGMFFAALPLGVVVSVLFSLVIYKDRINYYNQPERFAHRQKVLRDSLFLGGIGFFLGIIISLISGYSFF